MIKTIILNPKVPKERMKIINHLEKNFDLEKDELEEMVSIIKQLEVEVEYND